MASPVELVSFQHAAPSGGCHPSSAWRSGLQRKNCYIFGSCLRRCGKGWWHKSHSKALRDEIAEVSKPCSFPPSPPTPLHPRRGDQGSSTAIFGQRFVWGGVHVQRPTFKLAGNRGPCKCVEAARVHFEGGQSTVNATPLKTRPQPAVESHFESWRLTVNSTTSNTRPHPAVGSPDPPGGAGEGLGVRVGVAAQELLHC